MLSLAGRIIAITEARRAKEMIEHIAKLGGVPLVAPALREVILEDAESVRVAIQSVCRGEMDWTVFLTGTGTRAILQTAARMGCRDAFLTGLMRIRLAARGPKPIGVLREAGLRPELVPEEPTSEGLLRAFGRRGLLGKRVAVQLYGGPSPVLVGGLEQLGATVLEMQPYAWDLPADQEPLERLIRRIIEGSVDAVSFTSGIQVHHLFRVGSRLGLADSLRSALSSRIPVAAIGEVTQRVLASRDITSQIVPPIPTMGALVVALAKALGPGRKEEGEGEVR